MASLYQLKHRFSPLNFSAESSRMNIADLLGTPGNSDGDDRFVQITKIQGQPTGKHRFGNSHHPVGYRRWKHQPLLPIFCNEKLPACCL
jgi:hypothetical protein